MDNPDFSGIPKHLKGPNFQSTNESPGRLESPVLLFSMLEGLKPGQQIRISFPTDRNRDVLEMGRMCRVVRDPTMGRNSILPIIITGFNKSLLGLAGTLSIHPPCSIKDD